MIPLLTLLIIIIRSRYSEYLTGWMIRGSNPSSGAHQASNLAGTGVLSTGLKRSGREADRSRACSADGVITPLPYMPSWRVPGSTYLLLLLLLVHFRLSCRVF